MSEADTAREDVEEDVVFQEARLRLAANIQIALIESHARIVAAGRHNITLSESDLARSAVDHADALLRAWGASSPSPS